MDPNGFVLSLKGLRLDLSAVKQLMELPRGEKGSGGEPEVIGLNPDYHVDGTPLPFMQIHGDKRKNKSC